MPNPRIQVIIDALNLAEDELKQVDREMKDLDRGSKRATSGMKEMRQGILVATAAIAGFGIAAKKAFAFAEEGAQLQRFEESGQRLAAQYDQNMMTIVDSIQEASGFTIDRMTAMQAANNAMILDVAKSPEEFEKLTKSAVALGRATGRTGAQSIQDLTTGIGRLSRRTLDNLGILVDAEKDYAAYAKQIGKTADELTDAEKKQALLNKAVEAAQPLLDEQGEVMKDNAAEFEQAKAEWKDFTGSLKKGTLKAVLPAVEAINDKREASEKVQKAMESGIITQEEVNEILRKQHTRYVDLTEIVELINEKQREYKYELASTNPILLKAMGIYQVTEEQLVQNKGAIQGVTDEMVEHAKAAIGAKEKIGNWLDEIDRDISSPIENLVKDLEWTIATQGRFEDAFGTIEEGLREGVVAPEETVGPLKELYVLTQDMREELGMLATEKAVENVAEFLGISSEKAEDMLEDTQGALEVLQELRGEMLDFELGIYYGEGDRTYGDPTEPATALLSGLTPEVMEYTVEWGDTLSGIAEDTGTTVDNLMNMNEQITNPDLILAGEELRVPFQNTAKDVDNINQSLDDISGRDYEFNLQMNIVPNMQSGQMSEQRKDVFLEYFFNRLGD